jgi:hypothetical protein
VKCFSSTKDILRESTLKWSIKLNWHINWIDFPALGLGADKGAPPVLQYSEIVAIESVGDTISLKKKAVILTGLF